jgi:hypothetical protein
MPPTQFDNYRMPTPQAHPMNDGLSLYPQAGAVSCLRPPAQIASKKAPIFCRIFFLRGAGAYSIAEPKGSALLCWFFRHQQVFHIGSNA